jgi:hypothetical protein
MRVQVEDEWEGWDGDTVVKLTNGQVWRQTEYYYEYRYAYRPQATLSNNVLFVDGMRRGIRVERLD